MIKEEAIKELKESHDIMRSYDVDESESRLMIALDMAIKALEYDDAKYHEEHGEVIVDKAVWEDAKKALEQQSMPTMVYPQVEGITPVVVEPIPKLPPVNQQEPCGDLISRQDAIKAIDEKAKRIKNEDTLNGLAGAVGILFDLPSVNPQEPKTGHWEQFGNSWEDKFKCSKCGKEQPKILCGERIIGHWSDYCPNCGADMRESEEQE